MRSIFFKIIFLLPALWVMNISEVSATHIVGGNLTYKHISGDLYFVTVSIIRFIFARLSFHTPRFFNKSMFISSIIISVTER